MSEPTTNLSRDIMAALDGLAPVFESAKGLRARLEADGWSPTAAEAVALEWLQGIIRKAVNL